MKYLPKKGKPVTIGIGIICKDRIVMATDSQITRGHIKRTDARKISRVDFKNGSVLVAEAGNTDRAENVISKFMNAGKQTELADHRIAAEALQQVLIDYKREVRESRFNCSAKELDDYFYEEEQHFDLMLAHYFDGKPYIFVGGLPSAGVSKRADLNSCYFEAIGSGKDLAEYLLEEYARPEMEFPAAMATALFVISEVKRKETYCSGQTRYAFIEPNNNPKTVQQSLIDGLSTELERFHKFDMDDRNKKMADALDQVGKTWVQKNKEAMH